MNEQTQYYITDDYDTRWHATGAKTLRAAKSLASREYPGTGCHVGMRSCDLHEPVDADPARIVTLASKQRGRWGHRVDIDLLISA